MLNLMYIMARLCEHNVHKEHNVRGSTKGRAMNAESVSLEIHETLARINSAMPSLRPAEQRVAQFILANPRLAVEMSVTEIARAVDTSETSVIRLAKALGFAGFRGLKLAVATEIPANYVNVYQDLKPGESMETVATVFFSCVLRAFTDTASLMDFDSLRKAVELVDRGGKVVCVGSGASGYVALDAQQKLLRVNVQAWAFTDPHEQLASAARLGAGDTVIAISHSGYTSDVIEAVKVAKERGAAAVAIVGDPASELAKASDVVLVAASHEVPLKSGTVVSRLTQLAVVDTIALGIASRHQEEIVAQFRTMQTVLNRSRSKNRARPNRR